MWLLSVDLGEASIGWAAFRLDPTTDQPVALKDGGVRVFSNSRDPQNNQPANVERRVARLARRNRERTQMRQKSVESWLVQVGLLADFQHDVRSIDPYEARNVCADGTSAASNECLARAMLHIAKSRGYKSNRRQDTASDTEAAKDQKELAQKQTALASELGDLTLGQWLYKRQREDIKAAVEAKNSGGSFHHRRSLRFKKGVEYFPTRSMLEDEFEIIKEAQSSFHSLSDAEWTELRSRIFYQRPLKPQEKGKCTLFPKLTRAWKALPTSEAFRIEQDLANLRYITEDQDQHFLSPTQRDEVRSILYRQKSKTFKSLLKMKSHDGTPIFPDAVDFNLGSKADAMNGALTHISLAKALGESTIASMNLAEQDRLVEQLILGEDDQTMRTELRIAGYDIDGVENLLKLSFVSGTTNLCLEAMSELLEFLRAGMNYADAVKELKDEDGTPLVHTGRTINVEKDGLLPYYGAVLPSAVIGGDINVDAALSPEQHYGKIQNPTVHVGLNQLRQLTNSLIKRYGHPKRVHIELSREIGLGAKGRGEVTKQQKANKKRNQLLNDEAVKAGAGSFPSRNDRLKIELWQLINSEKPVDRRCVYTGKQIAAYQLFNGEVEIEHLLPYSRTLDDNKSNKLLAMKTANFLKGDKTPFEAFGNDQHADKGIVWSEILERVAHLPKAWRWRFGHNAMQRFTNDPKNGFVARSLNDTRYLSKIAKQYLDVISTDPTVVVTGRHTANLRHDWGLNTFLSDSVNNKKDQKNRDDHRHHLIDAFVVGMTSRSVLQSMAANARRRDSDNKFRRGHYELSSQLRDQLQNLLGNVVISVKPERNANGKFYEETALGFKPALEHMEQDRTWVTTVSVVDLANNPEQVFGPSKLKGILDPAISRDLHRHLAEAQANGVKEGDALKQFLHGPFVEAVSKRSIKKLKVALKDASVAQIRSVPNKGYARAGYSFADVWILPANSRQRKTKYVMQFIDLATAKSVLEKKVSLPDAFNLNQKNHPHYHPAAKRLMRLFKHDILQISGEDGPELMRVFGFKNDNNGRLHLGPLAGSVGSAKLCSIGPLMQSKMQKVNVQIDGSVVGKNK